MAWKEMSMDELAESLGLDVNEVREKQKLVQLIIKYRKEQKLSQAALAKKMGVSQPTVASLESRKDMRVSTLHRLVRACGGTLRVSVKLPGRKSVNLIRP